MKYFDINKNKIFFGSKNKLDDWKKENEETIIEKTKLLLKNYLELDNVSFLFGSGTSIHLGSVSIRSFPIEVEIYIKSKGEDIYNNFIKIIIELQSDLLEFGKLHLIEGTTNIFLNEYKWECKIEDDIVRYVKKNDNDSDIAIEFEKVLNYLIAYDYVLDENKSVKRTDKIKDLITAIKEGLFNVCNLENREVPETIQSRKAFSEFENENEQGELLLKNKYIFHEKFIKALLQRPLNLKRANIFTANYDLAFEYSFDKLGVHYIDGFFGFHKRFFKPETFEYDIFYPGSTTAGKVQRIEKVVRYFKLHGSLSWISSDTRDANNLYGIEEKPLELIESMNKKGEVIIYPSAVKKTYTLDLPYSELFRQFASTISQPQSLLITVGYSFCDDHFNDIIYQALSNPTFTLIVVDFQGTKNENINKLKSLKDPRIIILEGEFFGDFLTFADTLMPNFNDFENNDKVAETLNSILSTKTNQQDTPNEVSNE